MVGSVVVRDVMVVTRVKILQFDPKGKPLFEMCWFYMGIAQIALDPPPPFQTGTAHPFFWTHFFHLFFDIAKMS